MNAWKKDTSALPFLHSSVRPLVVLVLIAVYTFAYPTSGHANEVTPAQPPTEPIVARVYFDGYAGLARLSGRLDIWTVDHDYEYVTALVTPAQYEWLLKAGYTVEIDTERTMRLSQTGSTDALACYRTVEETYTDMAQLASEHDTLAEWIDIGDSWDRMTPGGPAGYDLNVLRLTNESIPGPKPAFFLMGAIHAREMTTAELAARFAEGLLADYGSDPDVTWLLDHTELHVMPLANPDGRTFAEQGLLWRKNTDSPNACEYPDYGIDLNRNSSFKWNSCAGNTCSSSNPCSEVYRGTAPASEPETHAIEEYVASVFADQRGAGDTDAAPADTEGVFISLHSFGRWVLFPWGWDPDPAPNAHVLETLGQKFGYFNHYDVCQSGADNCLYPTDGTTDDWAYGDLGVASYTIELGTWFFEQCSYFEQQIVPANLQALRYALKAARRPYQTPAGPDTLDVAVTPATVIAGDAITLTATADDTRYFSGDVDVEPSQPISATRVSVDSPSWKTMTTTQMLPADGTFDAVTETVQTAIDTSGWPLGRHLILVESQDDAGNWGVPSAVFVNVVDTYRYWFPFFRNQP